LARLHRPAQVPRPRLQRQAHGRPVRQRSRYLHSARSRGSTPRRQPPAGKGRHPGPQRRGSRRAPVQEEGELMAVTIDVVGSDRKVTLDLPEPKESVLHEVVAWQLAKRRRGTASTQTRAEVTGSTAKIYPDRKSVV